MRSWDALNVRLFWPEKKIQLDRCMFLLYWWFVIEKTLEHPTYHKAPKIGEPS